MTKMFLSYRKNEKKTNRKGKQIVVITNVNINEHKIYFAIEI